MPQIDPDHDYSDAIQCHVCGGGGEVEWATTPEYRNVHSGPLVGQMGHWKVDCVTCGGTGLITAEQIEAALVGRPLLEWPAND